MYRYCVTNYDVLIERAAAQLGGEVEVALDGDEAAFFKTCILKIHGCQRRKLATVWCPEQLDKEPILSHMEKSQVWLKSQLRLKDLISVGFWSDWSYLNDLLESCVNGIDLLNYFGRPRNPGVDR